MFRFLFLLFLLVPAIEIALFIKIGGVIGVLPTLLLIVTTAILGIILLRMQGLSTLARVQQVVRCGEVPAVELVESFMLVISAVFLLTPGFFTDTIGFVVLLPSVRRRLAIWILTNSNIMTTINASHTQNTYKGAPDRRIIEGEYQRKS